MKKNKFKKFLKGLGAISAVILAGACISRNAASAEVGAVVSQTSVSFSESGYFTDRTLVRGINYLDSVNLSFGGSVQNRVGEGYTYSFDFLNGNNLYASCNGYSTMDSKYVDGYIDFRQSRFSFSVDGGSSFSVSQPFTQFYFTYSYYGLPLINNPSMYGNGVLAWSLQYVSVPDSETPTDGLTRKTLVSGQFLDVDPLGGFSSNAELFANADNVVQRSFKIFALDAYELFPDTAVLDGIYQDGYQDGYDDGYQEAIDVDKHTATIFSGIIDVALLPINVFLSIFDFNLFGINFKNMVAGILTAMIAIILIRTFSGGKDE